MKPIACSVAILRFRIAHELEEDADGVRVVETACAAKEPAFRIGELNVVRASCLTLSLELEGNAILD